MYCDINFQSKKELKAAVASGRRVTVFSPGPFPAPENGRTCVEGPHYPKPYKWYAEVDLKHGQVVKVR